jgi:hypothetical protein
MTIIVEILIRVQFITIPVHRRLSTRWLRALDFSQWQCELLGLYVAQLSPPWRRHFSEYNQKLSLVPEVSGTVVRTPSGFLCYSHNTRSVGPLCLLWTDAPGQYRLAIFRLTRFSFFAHGWRTEFSIMLCLFRSNDR